MKGLVRTADHIRAVNPADVSGDLLRSSRLLNIPNVPDATPNARGSTRGQLRRIELFRVDEGGSEKARRLEEVLAGSPSKVTAIEHLQWGTAFESGPASKTLRGYVLLTFADEATRDACLADMAYKEYEEPAVAFTPRSTSPLIAGVSRYFVALEFAVGLSRLTRRWPARCGGASGGSGPPRAVR